MVTIYVLENTKDSNKSVEMVTEEVGQVAKEYINLINHNPYSNNPNIQVWKDGKFVYNFFEVEKDYSKLVRVLGRIINNSKIL